MFTLADYVGIHKASPDWSVDRQSNARLLIFACTKLQERMEAAGIHFHINPKTNSTISGETMGGFRPQDCTIGAPDSAHKEGMAVDRYDWDGHIDEWLLAHPQALIDCGIFLESPDSTVGWSHWQIRATHNRIFLP